MRYKKYQSVDSKIQRVSCNCSVDDYTPRCEKGVINKSIQIGCKPESVDYFKNHIFDPTWHVYVRNTDNVDLGAYVKRVTYQMWPRLPMRLSVAEESPFEVTEVLPTDFPLEIKIEYVDRHMTPTVYIFKPRGLWDGKYDVDEVRNYLGDDQIEQMVFVNPARDMRLKLLTPMAAPKKKLLTIKYKEPPRRPATCDKVKRKKKVVAPRKCTGRITLAYPFKQFKGFFPSSSEHSLHK